MGDTIQIFNIFILHKITLKHVIIWSIPVEFPVVHHR